MEEARQRLVQDKDLFPEGTEIHLEPLSGGLTNELFLVSSIPQTHQRYVYRRYVSGTISPEELQITQILSTQGLCPKNVRTYKNARLEEYRPLKPPSHMEFVFHLRDYFPLIHQMHIIDQVCLKTTHHKLLKTLTNWLAILDSNTWPEHVQSFATTCLEEYESPRFEHYCLSLCHNDLHCGNFLGPNTMIDLEYAGLGYEIYDWANLANEVELVLIPIQNHESQPHQHESQSQHEYQSQPNPSATELIFRQVEPGAKLADFHFFRNLSHLVGACWALAKAQTELTSTSPSIEFDYHQYAQLRFSLIKD